MRIDSYNKKIAALIVIFPPIILIIYAVVSYSIFYTSENTSDKKIIQFYKKDVTEDIINSLKTKVNTLAIIVSNNDKNLFKNVLSSLKVYDCKHIILFKNDKIIFSTKKNLEIPKRILNVADGYYESRDYIVYSKYANNGIKIVAFMKKEDIQKKINYIKNQLDNARESSLKNTIFWLTLIWFILLFVSLWLSTSVYKRLKEYEKSIDNTNKDIIFQSRQAMLGELLPMIAHQWRQPLNKIASVLMRMRFEIMSGHPNTQTLDRQSQIIEDSVELMSQTIDDFRTFYRPKENPQEVDLSIIVRKAVYFLEEPINKKKIKVIKNLMPIKYTLYENEFLQVLINLIKNAVDAVKEKGEIDIFLKEFNDGRIELRVEDNGTGIPEDKLEKIFEAHESSKQASMGLGLYMSKLIIEERIGGKISAYNTPRGAGFLILLYRK